jgi:hypothetical protein
VKKVLLAAVVFVPGLAAAQVPVYPSGYPSAQVPQAPINMDPGTAAAPVQPPPPPPQQPSKPNVVVVKPDGSTSVVGGEENEPRNFYMGGNDQGGGDQGGEEPAEVHGGPVPELHVVRKGDTLWDICWYYFNDPWQWPKIWSYNPQISNPHWIYPGDLVRLLPRGVFAGGGGPEEGGAGQGGGSAAQTAAMPDNVPAPAQKSQVGIKNTAFVEKSDLDRSMTIDGAVDEKVLLGNGDSVYISYPKNKPPQVGKRYSIYTPDHDVKGYGSYVHVFGAVEIVSVKEDKRARGVIVESNMEIERGMKVGPLMKTFSNVPPTQPNVDAQGEIVAMLAAEQLIGKGEVVFVNLGKGAGVEPGNRMFVVRRGDAHPGISESNVGQDDRRFPARAVGEITIIDVGQKISVGLVTLSVQEMGVGDLVMMQKAR